MLTGAPLSRFRKNLLEWFAEFQRDLPWRRTRDPYRIWLSEIMLQQTRVAAVIPYYERFLEQFPTVDALARAPQEDVLRLWSGLGYYSRARNLQKTAQLIVSKHNGVFPNEPEEALALPGIGAYTAAAILSIAYQKKHAVLDGNVARVIARLNALRGDLHANGTWQKLQKTADHLLQVRSPGDWNQAMMELGATLCTPRSPQCLLCPVSEFCEARKKGLVDLIPAKRSKRTTVGITLASLVLVDARGKTLLLSPPNSAQKSASPGDVHTLVSRMWHFPTIAVPQARAVAELKKFTEESLFNGRSLRSELFPLKKVRHAVTYRSITIFPFRAEVEKLPRVSGAKAFLLADLSAVPISNLTRKVARAALASK
ncbi:MAG TPA: A/G-specific adenine glycosylase [Candidatus Sulfotelmatobacter sp.]|jgi:A/G-specific adenine glycosylase|nr:A/G-specific adenine glycosylase [Candidatus Sulfotelmatobacter sp.]